LAGLRSLVTQAGSINDIGMRCGSSGEGLDQRDSTTQLEAGYSYSVYGPFEAVGCGVRVRSGQATRHTSAGATTTVASNVSSKERLLSGALSVYFQAAQKGMR
jgi:hypothetical protein